MFKLTILAKQKLRRMLHEGMLIGGVVFNIFLLVALFSYDNRDSGWSVTAVDQITYNMMGPIGALVADILLSTVGYVAYLLLVIVFIWLWRLFSGHQHGDNAYDWLSIVLRTSGVLLMLLSMAAIAEYNWHPSNFGMSLPMGSGGIIGMSMAESILVALGHMGSNLVLAGIFLFGLTLFLELTWLALFERIGALVLVIVQGIGSLLQRPLSFFKQLMASPTKFTRRSSPSQNEVNGRLTIPVTYEDTHSLDAEIDHSKRDGIVSETIEREMRIDAIVKPSLDLLDSSQQGDRRGYTDESITELSQQLELKLADFGISVEVVSILQGPVVTRFEIQPAAGVKASRISSLARDIARSLAVPSVRVVEVIAGKSVMGIEIPNKYRQKVCLGDVIASPTFAQHPSPLALALGYDIAGIPVVADIATMPHLLVAGTTGSGKSVAINAMLLSMLYKASPEQLRLILIDPKMLELSVYDSIPHLLTPVITDMSDAANGLRWCVAEMERRYQLMSKLGVRNLAGYNRKVQAAMEAGKPLTDPLWKPSVSDLSSPQGEDMASLNPTLESLPSIVVIIDELADMMMMVGKKVEQLIARIAQKARAAGIHLILATQRPSVDVITGLIKANIPARIGFQVSSRIDSRTILDQGGAEQLLGHGDMLFLPPGTSVPQRIHGAFVDDHEIHKVVTHWKQCLPSNYVSAITEAGGDDSTERSKGRMQSDENNAEQKDILYDEAVEFVCQSRKASISSLQRKLRVGYNRAARLIETMENAGVVSAMESNGNRVVLAPKANDE